MHRECRERFPCHRLQRKPLVSDPGMHHGTCVSHVPWCMSGSLTRGGGGNVPGILGACATRNFTYLARGPCWARYPVLVGCEDSHDDVIKWKHFPRYWPFVRGIHRSPVNTHDKGQWRGALVFSLISAWAIGWVNNRDAGDLRHYRPYYNATVMLTMLHVSCFVNIALCVILHKLSVTH